MRIAFTFEVFTCVIALIKQMYSCKKYILTESYHCFCSHFISFVTNSMTCNVQIAHFLSYISAGICFFKVNNGNTWKMLNILSKLILEGWYNVWRYQMDVIDVLVSLLVTLNRFLTLFCFFLCWHWTSKCQLGYYAIYL